MMAAVKEEKLVVIEVPQGLAKWVRALQRFYESPRHGSCEFHKKRESRNIEKFVPRPVYLEDDEFLLL